MTYHLSQRSEAELVGVHPRLVAVVRRAIQITEQDFGVHDGIRTAAEQRALYNRGVSQRDGYQRKSEHQVQESGYGHAVDLVPYVPGRGLVWEWPLIYPICEAMVSACAELSVDVRWGGAWVGPIHKLGGAPENWVQDYVRRRQKQGRRAFNDGPHYELM